MYHTRLPLHTQCDAELSLRGQRQVSEVCLQDAASEPRLLSPETQEVVAQGRAASGVLVEGRYLTRLAATYTTLHKRELEASPDFQDSP